MRRNSLLLVNVTVASLILVLYVVLSNILSIGFAQVETQNTNQNVQRAIEALSSESKYLQAKSADWANWDDTYAFIQDGNAAYIGSNQGDQSLHDISVNLMLFIRNPSELVFAKAFDLQTEQELPVPQALLQHLSSKDLLLQPLDTENPRVGILLLPEGPLLIVSRPILTSQGQGPSRGTFIIGRYLDASQIAQLSQTTHLTLEVRRFDDSQLPPDLLAARASLSEQKPVFIQASSAQSIAGYTLLKDIYGQPALLLEASMPRPIYAQGQATLHYILLALIIIGAMGGATSTVLVARLTRAWQARRESEERFRAVTQSANDAIVSTDKSGKIVSWNHGAQQMFLYTEQEVLDQSVARVLQLSAEGDGRTKTYQALALRRDGRQFPVEISSGAWETAKGAFKSFIIRDIAERLQEEEAIQRRADEFAALYETTRDLAAQQELSSLLQTVVERATRLLGVQGGVIHLYDPVRNDLELAVAKDDSLQPGTRRAMGDGISGQVAQTREPMIVDDYRLWEGRSPRFEEMPVTSVLRVPMLYGGELVGVLGVHEVSSRTRKFTEADLRLLTLFASHTAGAVHNARLFAETRQRAEQLGLLYGAGLMLNNVPESHTQLESWFKLAAQALHADRGGLFRYDATSNEFAYEVGVEANVTRQEARRGLRIPAEDEKDPLSWVGQQRTPLTVGNLPDDARWHPMDRDIRSGLWVPIEHENRLLGILAVSSSEINAFSPADERLLILFANQAAIALENARLFSETEHRLQHLRALREVDEAISSNLELRLTLDVVLKQVVAQLGVDAADVLLINPETHTLTFAAGIGFRSQALQHTALRLGEGLAGRAALERRLVSVPDLVQGMNGLRRSPLFASECFDAYYGVPLVAKGLIKGVLEVFHRTKLKGDPEWLELIEALAGQAAIAIDNAELLEGLQHSNLELALAYDTTLEGWAHALDLRDKETEGHTRRVTEMTTRLASLMGFEDAELVHLRRGALLHDIGKMAIPDRILHKPGPLTEEEWKIMRKHPDYAYELLSPIAYLRPALATPRYHHEKWDGTGYPQGLKGEQIPLAARIFAVVDVWDALRSDRPYRKAWSEEKVREYIRAQSGKHFDPTVVDAFMELLDSEAALQDTGERAADSPTAHKPALLIEERSSFSD